METSKNQTRRTFLTNSGIVAGAAVASLSIAMADGSVAHADEVHWDEEFDVVVVGAGIAGNAAAVTLATEGDVSVLLAEKGEVPSGNSPYSDMDIAYTEDADADFTYIKNMCGPYTDVPESMMRAFADGLAENLDWVKGLGGIWEEMQYEKPGTADNPVCNSDVCWPELEGSYAHGWFAVGHVTRDQPGYKLTGATDILDLLQTKIEENSDSVEYRTSAPAEGLIKDNDSGRIVGVVINGKNVKANKGVIMACGGFEHDEVMMEGYLGMPTAIAVGGKGNTGDGHRMCAKIGANFWHMNAFNGMWLEPRNLDNTLFSHDIIWGECIKKYGITVAMNGRRFCMDYDGLRTNWDENYLSDLATSTGTRYGYQNFGGEWKWIPLPSKGTWFIFDQDALEAGAIPQDTTTDPVGDGWAYSADTIEELADKIGVPSDELSKTVDFWNELCEKGEDLAFYRPADTMTLIKNGPFYAEPCVPTFLNTQGGPVRSERAEILDPDGNPIPGLYSAGEFGSIWSYYYQSCGNIGECLVSGRIAARSILSQE